VTDPTLAVVQQQDEEIAEAEQEIALLTARLGVLRGTLDDLIAQREALVQIALRRGYSPNDLMPPRTTNSDDAETDWLVLSRVDAIERVLRECSTSIHLAEIEGVLKAHGRTNDSTESISATLAHIRKTRHTVASLGAGRWEYVRAGTSAAGHPPYPVQLGVSQEMGDLLSGGPHPDQAREAGGGTVIVRRRRFPAEEKDA